MALQGTLDTFELPDVLRLLASTKKSGRLQLRSERGEGNVWLVDGQVVSVRSDGMPDGEPDDGLFDMLRAHEGSFAFSPGEESADAGLPSHVEPLLVAAEKRLAEWREIEAVVPSLRAWVSLAGELPAPELTIDAATWKLVTTIGSGLTVGDLGRIMDLSEIPVCRMVRDLVQLGIGVVSTDGPPAVAGQSSWTTPTEKAGYSGGSLEPVQFDEPVQPSWDAGTNVVDEHDVTVESDDAGFATDVESTGTPAATASFDASDDDVPTDEEADEVARQLAMLSPRAAQAVAAAAAADTDAERDAALEILDETEEPINRGLLLKFLSSVKS